MGQDSEPLQQIARNLCWWQPAALTLSDPPRFLIQVMVLGTWQEVQKVNGFFGWGAFKDALLNAPAGVFDVRSWAYWRAVFGLPEAELPRRSLT